MKIRSGQSNKFQFVDALVSKKTRKLINQLPACMDRGKSAPAEESSS